MKKLLRIFGIFFLVLIAAHVALNVLWGTQLRNTIRDLKAEGKLKTWDEIKPPPVPDDENAALLYEKVFELMTTGEGGNKYVDGIHFLYKLNNIVSPLDRLLFRDYAYWTPEQKQVIPKLVNSPEMQKIYRLLQRASQKPSCNFVDYSNPQKSIQESYSSMWGKPAQLLFVKAQVETLIGDVSKAVDTVTTAIRVVHHFMQQSSPILPYNGLQDKKIITNFLEKISQVKNVSPEKFQSLLQVYSEVTDASGILIAELEAKNVQDLWWIEKVPEDVIDFSSLNSFYKLPTEEQWFQTMIRISPSFYLRFFAKLLYTKSMQTELLINAKLIKKLQLPLDKLYAEIQNGTFDRDFPKCCDFTKYLTDDPRGVIERAMFHQAKLNVGQLGLALKIYRGEHGNYPDSLDKLVPNILEKIPNDPYTGKELVYKKSVEGFVLYSLGPDLQDNHGAPMVLPAGSKTDEKLPPYDIVWGSEN